jgi:ACS family glucarate transporter-like MFS transporter
MNWVWYIFFSWLMVYLVDVRGFDIINAGMLAAAPWIAGSFGAGLGGEACDRLCQRIGPRWGCRLPAMAGLCVSAIMLISGAYAPDPYIAVAFLSLCYACNQFTEGAYWQATTFVGGRYTAAAGGVLNTGGNIAGVIATVPCSGKWQKPKDKTQRPTKSAPRSLGKQSAATEVHPR